ncbi:hypothetical protein L2Y96_11930 [Luteibacter aegosomaticola]|jgi:hypothetical protein|uniref:hypothetical protein n=1 Tax=Luteibacter aegosomaticola TaxID=2911538 RepID=UPI001FF8AE98|nr:hypothetical protein [Luteibacter aegosomaticola]UPG88127.1 hypothetical protein L2Y96_11930 [Luteibacter aegosomaticola]
MPVDAVQVIRRRNLRLLVAELRADGITQWKALAQALGIDPGVLDDIRTGATISDPLAREIEWAMQRPAHWMDRASHGELA